MPIQLGKIGGIPIALDYSWFVIFFLIAWSVGYVLMPVEYPGLTSMEYGAIGLVASLLLFVSILIHELAHSTVARRSGLKIRRITLFLFGGVSEMEEEAKTASLELRMAIAGPLMSFALAGAFFLAWQGSEAAGAPSLVQAPLYYGALVNLIVAIFNMVPAFPMDGGRVLRSLIWRSNGDMMRATRTSVGIARGIAYVIMFAGVFITFFVDLVSGLWLVLIGWFITSGAQGELAQMMAQEELGRLHARDIMTRNVDSVHPDMTLTQLQDEIFTKKHNGFPVVADGELMGCVTVGDLKKAPRSEWQSKSVSEVMTPREGLAVVAPDEPATKAAQLMGSRSVGRIFVLAGDGALTGIITRSDIIKTLRLQATSQRAGTAPAGGSFVVERGMYFVIEQPEPPQGAWRAYFEPDRVRLASSEVEAHADGKKYVRFVFEALRPGAAAINLVVEGPAGAKIPGPVRPVKYVVSVEPPETRPA